MLLKIIMGSSLICACAVGFAEEKVLVMLGDSTTLCSRNKPGSKLTELVQSYLTDTKKLYVKVINSGVGGNTAKQGYERLQKDVIAHNPDFVTVSFGLNDTGYLTTEEYKDSLEKIIKKKELVDTLILPDGVHLTDEGNRVAAECLAPAIAEMLKPNMESKSLSAEVVYPPSEPVGLRKFVCSSSSSSVLYGT